MTFRESYTAYGLILVLSISYGVILCDNLKLGAAINLFERFGYLHISMRVMPRNESSWIFREPSVELFQDAESMRSKEVKNTDNSIFEGKFEMVFCDDLQDLFKIYFQEFAVEKLDEPWEAFVDSYSNETIAYNMGINVSYVTGDHCYVLIRITRLRENVSFSDEFDPANATINDSVLEKARTVKLGDVPSVWGFVKAFGSHYITSYSTGNSMYQVIVYSPKIYNKLKTKIRSSNSQWQALGNEEINSLFSPQYAEHMGVVLTSSGNASLQKWAESTLISSYEVQNGDTPYNHTYANLLKLYKNSKLLKELEVLLGNEALLHLNLKTVSPVFKDKKIRDWFLEVVDNNLKLWEVN